MSKKVLANVIKWETGCTNAAAADAVDAIVAAIIMGVKKSKKGRFSVRGLGTFAAKTTKARICRNPTTGGVVNVPAKKTVKFTPASGLVQNVGA
jgi:DNA-binding protein HU-beta